MPTFYSWVFKHPSLPRLELPYTRCPGIMINNVPFALPKVWVWKTKRSISYYNGIVHRMQWRWGRDRVGMCVPDRQVLLSALFRSDAWGVAGAP